MATIKVTVEHIDGYCNLPVQVGNHFFVEGSRLVVPEGQPVCLWALQCMMPVFPILPQRDRLAEGHWVRKVNQISCPDPKGKVQYRLELIEDGSDTKECSPC